MNVNKKRPQGRKWHPKKSAITALRLGLPIISLVLIVLTFSLTNDIESSPVKALYTYPELYSHVLSSLALLIIGAVILDIIEKKS